MLTSSKLLKLGNYNWKTHFSAHLDSEKFIACSDDEKDYLLNYRARRNFKLLVQSSHEGRLKSVKFKVNKTFSQKQSAYKRKYFRLTEGKLDQIIEEGHLAHIWF